MIAFLGKGLHFWHAKFLGTFESHHGEGQAEPRREFSKVQKPTILTVSAKVFEASFTVKRPSHDADGKVIHAYNAIEKPFSRKRCSLSFSTTFLSDNETA